MHKPTLTSSMVNAIWNDTRLAEVAHLARHEQTDSWEGFFYEASNQHDAVAKNFSIVLSLSLTSDSVAQTEIQLPWVSRWVRKSLTFGYHLDSSNT
ncbi:hypothetical protein EVAR_55241_1 [Eumeta japonica]|uniref:Uncharacterized protein n=1 Tax=Eumeta variegata TaxID=151549 RepID=A0A4C1Y8L9_EUMVA|nr:hypothetical protein EVAR_55241_1 [Eumeta japonica]